MKEVLLIFLWINIVVISGDTYNYNGYWCNKCPSGTYVKKHCSATSQTECEACPEDTFSPESTQLTQCHRCGRYCLRKYEQVIQRCNKTHDIVCHCEPGYWLQNPEHIYCEEHRQCRPGTGVIKLGTPFSDTKCRRCGLGMFSDTLSSIEPCILMTDCVARGMVVKIPGNARKDNLCVVAAAGSPEDRAQWPDKSADKGSVISSTPGQDDNLKPGEEWVGPPPDGDTHQSYYHAAPVVTVLPPYIVMNNSLSPTTTKTSSPTTEGAVLQSDGSVGSQVGGQDDQSWKNYVLFAGVAVGSLIVVFVILFSACFLLRMKRKWPFKPKPKHTTYDEAKDPLNIGQQMHKVFGFVAANCDNNTWQTFIQTLQGDPVTQQEINSIVSSSRGAVVQQIYQCLSLWYAKNNCATVEDVITALYMSGEHNLADQVRKDNPQTRIIYR